MTRINPPSPIYESDYKAIEEALLDSARGRWFLSEYARQNRTADTQMLLDAITKLEAAVMRPARNDDNHDHIRSGLIEMSETIARTRQEIAAMASSNDDSHLVTATGELDAIVKATENATSSILEAAEDVQETAWLLREKGAEDQTCDRLDQRATDIYTACSFQDITGQRTGKVVEILRYVENRVNTMIDIWGLDDVEMSRAPLEDSRADGHLLNGPQLEGRGLEQADIDDMISVEIDEIDIVESQPEQSHADAAPAGAETLSPTPEQAELSPVPGIGNQLPHTGEQQPVSAARLPAAHAPSAEIGATQPLAETFAPRAMTEEAAGGLTGETSNPAPEPEIPEVAEVGEPVTQARATSAGTTTAGAAHTGAVSANEFTTPQGLTLDDLDATKKTALFS